MAVRVKKAKPINIEITKGCLYKYQIDLYKKIVKELSTGNLACLAATTGAGKTEIAAQMIMDNPKSRVLILAHGQSVLRTNFEECLKGKKKLKDQVFCMTKGNQASLSNDYRVVVTLPQTIHKKLSEIKPFDIILTDEAHQFYSDDRLTKVMYPRIVDWHKGKTLLLTASHYRLKTESKVFYSREKALKDKRVDDVKVFMKIADAHLVDSDYTASDELKVKAKVPTSSDLIKDILTPGRLPAIISKHSIASANALYTELNAMKKFKGKVFVSTSDEDKDSTLLNEFKAGKFPILIVVNRGILGFDHKKLATFIDGSYSGNVERIEQCLGRVARQHPDGIDKHYYKIIPPQYFAKFHLVMAAVYSLGVSEIYETWDGDYKKVKITLASTPEQLAEGQVRAIAESKAREEALKTTGSKKEVSNFDKEEIEADKKSEAAVGKVEAGKTKEVPLVSVDKIKGYQGELDPMPSPPYVKYLQDDFKDYLKAWDMKEAVTYGEMISRIKDIINHKEESWAKKLDPNAGWKVWKTALLKNTK